MWLAISMVLGLLPISIDFGLLLGAMDVTVVVPVMQTGSLSGMLVGMGNTKMEAGNIEYSPL